VSSLLRTRLATEQLAAVRACGFTSRQARFLVLVLEHSGVCLPRQYRTFSRIAHGRETHAFFNKLVRGGFATTDLAAPARAGRIYHLQYKPWYRAIGTPDHPHRKAMSIGHAVDPSTALRAGRLMLLDGVLAEPEVRWLGLARDKVATFTTAPFCVPPDALPRATVGGVVRLCPDPFPIGLAADGSCLFLYLVTTRNPTTFRTFLTRHLGLLSALPSWRLRLLIPPALPDVRDAYIRTIGQVLEPVVGDGVEPHVALVPVTHAYLRLERLVGTA
jgi:hypothetical protein